MEYKKHLSEPWFSLINFKLKKVEGRLNKGAFGKMKKGDIITWFNNDFGEREFKCIVKDIKTYKTFYSYLRNEGLENCLPGINNLKQGVDVYRKYYSEEDEKKYGIIAIILKKI